MKQKTLLTYVDQISLQISRTQVVKGLLYLVTVDGRPFSALEDTGLLTAFGSILNCLPCKSRFHRNNIGNVIKLAADHIRGKISQILESSLVSLKVDCVSRFSRSYLCLNVQVILLVTNIRSEWVELEEYRSCLIIGHYQ